MYPALKPKPGRSLAEKFPDLTLDFDLTRNTLKPEDLCYGSRHRVNWKCRECGHEWQTTVRNRTSKRRRGCLECAKQTLRKSRYEIVLRKTGSLASTHPAVAAEWDESNKITPYEITFGSHYYATWKCKECGTKFQTIVKDRTKPNPTRCPNCMLKMHKEIVREARVKKRGSLAQHRPDLAKYWHSSKNGNLTPFDVTKGSKKKVWWICEKNHEWQRDIKTVTKGYDSCPTCSPLSSLGEKKIADIFNEFSITYTRQKRFDDCKTTRALAFDFSLGDSDSILIEYDGELHYKPWNDSMRSQRKFTRTKFNDNIKNRWAKKTGRHLYRIPYTMPWTEVRATIIQILKKHKLLLRVAV